MEKEIDDGAGTWGYFMIEIDKEGIYEVISKAKNLNAI